MHDIKISSITEEQLLNNGWERTSDPVYPLKKCITHKDHDYNPEDGDINLILHCLSNCWMFALSLPGGTIINIDPASIEDINHFERMILSVDSPY